MMNTLSGHKGEPGNGATLCVHGSDFFCLQFKLRICVL